jgi:hypothetical protein
LYSFTIVEAFFSSLAEEIEISSDRSMDGRNKNWHFEEEITSLLWPHFFLRQLVDLGGRRA